MALTVTARIRQYVSEIPLTALIGLAIIVLYALIAILAPVLAPYDQGEVVGGSFEPWSSSYLLGTDNIGRDVFSRLIYGARNSIGVALLATALAFVIGVTLGLAAAATGGWIDVLISRCVDMLMAIPKLIFALFVLTIFGSSIFNMVVVIAVLDSTRIFRVTRAVAVNVAALDFVEVARLRGERIWWIMLREILPNAAAPLLVEFGLRFIFVFLFISALGFLGLGIQPPSADWGSMVRDNALLIAFGSSLPIIPAAAIGVLAVGVSFVVDWVVQVTSRSDE